MTLGGRYSGGIGFSGQPSGRRQRISSGLGTGDSGLGRDGAIMEATPLPADPGAETAASPAASDLDRVPPSAAASGATSAADNPGSFPNPSLVATVGEPVQRIGAPGVRLETIIARMTTATPPAVKTYLRNGSFIDVFWLSADAAASAAAMWDLRMSSSGISGELRSTRAMRPSAGSEASRSRSSKRFWQSVIRVWRESQRARGILSSWRLIPIFRWRARSLGLNIPPESEGRWRFARRKEVARPRAR